MELIAKISKGSKMDQVYIPKNRNGFGIGSYVVIAPLEAKKITHKPYFYNINFIAPVKLSIVNEIINTIDKSVTNDSIIITGSFLDNGFNFNDIDVIIITKDKVNAGKLTNDLEEKIGIKVHLIVLNNKTLVEGLSTDPLYQMMLSKCIAKKRFVYRVKNKVNYKVLDLHLLKSKTLIDNFDLLDGNEKYYLTRNMVAIHLFLQNRKIDKEIVDKEINKIFRLKDIKEIKLNMLNKSVFFGKYKEIYRKVFNMIMASIRNGSK